MSRILTFAIAFAIFAAPTCYASGDADEAFLLQARPGDESVIDKLQFRADSDAMLVIDALSVTDPDSDRTWTAIHESVADFIKRTHQHQRVHIRFYHSNYPQTKPMLHQLHAKAKRELADLPIYVVMIDETVRNDHKPWSDYFESNTP